MLPSADAEVAKIRLTLDAVDAQIQSWRLLNELGDTAKMVSAGQASCGRDRGTTPRGSIGSYGANLQQAERRLANYAATEEEMDRSMKLTGGSLRARARGGRDRRHDRQPRQGTGRKRAGRGPRHRSGTRAYRRLRPGARWGRAHCKRPKHKVRIRTRPT
jgi:hypothetical protein